MCETVTFLTVYGVASQWTVSRLMLSVYLFGLLQRNIVLFLFGV